MALRSAHSRATESATIARVLVLRPGAIGDTLVTLPALLGLRRRFPAARIEVVGNSTALPIVEASGLIDSWVSFDDQRVTRLFVSQEPSADDAFLDLDVAIAWSRDADGTLRTAFERRGAANIVIAPSRPEPGQSVHVGKHLLESLAPLG